MASLRVLHVGKYYPPFAGGIENFHADLVEEQVRQGLAVSSIVHHHESGRKLDCEPCQDGTLWRVPIAGRCLYTPLAPRFRASLKAAVKQFHPAVLHFHVPNPSAQWAMTLRHARRIPWVVHWHSDIVASQVDRRLAVAYQLYKPIEQTFLRRASAIIATSPPYLESSLPLKRWQRKCHVVPLGIGPSRLPLPDDQSVAWAEQVWRPGGLRVLCVGRLTYYKGHSVLIEAMSQLPDIQLCLVGTGELMEQLRALVTENRLEERVQLLGYLPEAHVRALLTSCDCFCLPSLERTEAFGLVLAEAMRYGKAVVACRIPGSGVGWVVEPESTGVLIEPGDPQDLADAIIRLSVDVTFRKQLERRAAEAFGQRFAIAPVAEAITDIYRAAMAKPHAR